MSSGGLALGKYLRVTGSFGWGEKAGLVVNEALKSEARKLNGEVSKIVGFTVYNCAHEKENALVPQVFEIPIRRWKQVSTNPDVYEEVAQTLVLNPGDEAIIEACDFIAYILNNTETHGRTLDNGVIKQSSRGGKDARYLGKLTQFTPAEAAYFCFSFSPNAGMRLHDPEVKKAVGIKQGGVWKVKEQYKEYFGFLENADIHTRRVRKLLQQQMADRIRASYQLSDTK